MNFGRLCTSIYKINSTKHFLRLSSLYKQTHVNTFKKHASSSYLRSCCKDFKKGCFYQQPGFNISENYHPRFQQNLFYTTTPNDSESQVGSAPSPPVQSPGIFQKFKSAYKEYGKVLIGCHCVTSAIWFGSFFYLAKSGIDVVPLLEKAGVSQTIVRPFKDGGLGNIAVAYLMYKIATPGRYAVTIGSTQLTVKIFRYYGYMKPVPEGSRIRELVQEGKQKAKVKASELKSDISEKLEERKEQLRDKTSEIKGNILDKRKELNLKTKDLKKQKNGPDSKLGR